VANDPKRAHTRTSLASVSGWARVPMGQTRPCVECHEPGSRVTLPETDSEARLVGVWALFAIFLLNNSFFV
jgi:hypothetical protein